MPLVSIIIPTYNRAHLIGETIQSVLAQTLTKYEIIVVDDGSTDGTTEALAPFGARIHYLQEPHTGLPGHVRNVGIRAAQGDYFAFLDSDDLLVEHSLALRLDFLRRHVDVALVYSDAYVFDHTTGATLQRWHELMRPASGWIGPALLCQNWIVNSTVLVRRQVLDRIGLFAEGPELRWGQDWDLWLRIAAYHEIGLIPEPLARIRIHSESLTNQHDLLARCYRHLFILERARAFAPDVYEPVFCQAVNLQFYRGIRALVEQDRGEDARSLLAEAVRYDTGALRQFLDLLRMEPVTPGDGKL
jgi:glycosyltransferase involved in cell wall biosynthesis